MDERLEHLCIAAVKTMSGLEDVDIELRFEKPYSLPGMRAPLAASYKLDTYKARIEVDPKITEDGTLLLEALLHEAAHLRLHWQNMDPIAGKWDDSTLSIQEAEALAMSRSWLKWAEANSGAYLPNCLPWPKVIFARRLMALINSG